MSTITSLSPISFHLFPELPRELRLQIWEKILFLKRILELNYQRFGKRSRSTGPPPAILHVNQESREVALKFYHKSFGDSVQPAELCFNPLCDTAYLSSRLYRYEVEANAERLMGARLFKHELVAVARISVLSIYGPISDNLIESIAIGEEFWKRSRYNTSVDLYLSCARRSIAEFRNRFRQLKKMVLVRGTPTKEEIASWDLHSGISLVRSNMDKIKDDTLDIVLKAFDEENKNSDFKPLEVMVMEHPPAKKYHSFLGCETTSQP